LPTASPRRLALLACVAAATLGSVVAGPVRADDPPKKPGGGFRFSPPEGGDAETPPEEQPGQPASKPGGATDKGLVDPVAKAIRALATWPGQDGVKAAETLLLTGPSVVPALQRRSTGPTRRQAGRRVGARKVGEPAHVQALLRAAAERTSGSRLEVFFEAAYELDKTATKKWMFNFLAILERPVFRMRATEFLAGVVGPEDREKVEGSCARPRQP